MLPIVTFIRRAMLLSALLMLAACNRGETGPGHVLDEARLAGRDAASFPHAEEDYFRDMDRGLALSPDEIKGRNMWLVWSGGNDRFWDKMTGYTFGSFDLLKIVTSHPSQTNSNSRDKRWAWLGLINEPCFKDAAGPDPNRFGLYLDVRDPSQDPGCAAADPFENETKYPGVKIGARGTTVPVGSYYGYASGIVGLRLFPNPDFDETAKKNWDPQKYYTDPAYYNNPKLVRPYRVGMSCGFCHVGPNPVHPPANAAHPQFADLSSTVGAQYMWVDRLFIYSANTSNFMYQLVRTYRPGTMDTSLVSTDSINNARTMNAIYDLGTRLAIGLRIAQEKLAGGELNNKQFNDFPRTAALNNLFQKPDTVFTPHVLKDGADSVGGLGALNRVYLNIGLFSEEWLLHFNPVVGGKPITPIAIADAEKNSSYWQATEAGTPDTALFFLKSTVPDHLKEAPGGDKYLADSAAVLDRGKTVFAETCARCHSSKAPPVPPDRSIANCIGPNYLDCFKRYWAYTQTADYKTQMNAIVHAPDFLDGNFLSTDARIPVTLLRTNACSPLATNGIRGNVWDNFTSESYKNLPSVGTVTTYDPYTGDKVPYKMPAGGRGYTRPPSLIALWSSAPYLLNNSVGTFNQDPSVDGRMSAFNESIEEMLWPEKRKRDTVLGDKLPGVIDRTTERSYVYIPVGYLPDALRPLAGSFAQAGSIPIGPIPAGTPVGLLANTKLRPEDGDNPAEHAANLLKLTAALVSNAPTIATANQIGDDALRQKLASVRAPFLALSKCPDFVVNRGHYFGTAAFNEQEGLSADEKAFGTEPALSDDDKRALIAFLKTL
ncbi:MAG TPA: hypothetical protein VGM72_01280 [Micropepsaceae bacterium]|jgi:hypothetical protein